MSFVRNAIIGALAVGAASIVACSAGPQDAAPSTSSGSAGGTGNLGFELQLGPGISVSSVSYSISNPTLPGFSTIANVLDVSGSSTVSFSVALPAGSGYTLTLSATDSAGDPCLGGPVAFTVVAGQTNPVALTLVCQQTIDGGNVGPDVSVGVVTVTADASVQTTTLGGSCAAATVLSAGPGSQVVGGSVGLLGAGIDPSFQSSDVSLAWTATGGAGALASTSGASNTFTCAATGVETITLTAAIASTGASCAGNGSLSVQITCTGVGVVDAGGGTVDAGGAGVADAGGGTVDAGSGGGLPTACTTAPCAASGANSVQCPDSPTSDGVCTVTESLIVAADIAKGNLGANGQLKPFVSTSTTAGNGSCYTCLNAKSCLDDDEQDVGNECSDAPATFNGSAGPSSCLATLSCILTTDCQGAGGIAGTSATATQESTQLCYCGGNNAGSVCSTAGSATDGLCATQEAAGMGFPVTDNKDILANYGDQSLPSGLANQILQCASSNRCTICN